MLAIRQPGHRNARIGLVVQAVRIAVGNTRHRPGYRRCVAAEAVVHREAAGLRCELSRIPGGIGLHALQRVVYVVGDQARGAVHVRERALLVLATLVCIVRAAVLVRPGGAGLGLRHDVDGAGLAIQHAHGGVGQVAIDDFLAPDPFGVNTQHNPVGVIAAVVRVVEPQHVHLAAGVVIGLARRSVRRGVGLRDARAVGVTAHVIGVNRGATHGHRPHVIGGGDDGVVHLLRHVVVEAQVEHVLEDPGAPGRAGVERRGVAVAHRHRQIVGADAQRLFAIERALQIGGLQHLDQPPAHQVIGQV